MRECWINVYALKSGVHTLGWTCSSLDEAKWAGRNMVDAGTSPPAYRLHVRLKPGVELIPGGWRRTTHMGDESAVIVLSGWD